MQEKSERYDPYTVYDPPEELILFRSITRPLAKRLKDTWIHPNYITVFGFLLTVACGLLFLDGNQQSLILGAVMLYLSFFLDKLNGDLAREKKVASEFGYFFDSACDIFGDTYVFIMLYLGSKIPLNPLVVILAIVSPLLFYYHHLASLLYLKKGVITAKTKASIFAYNRARHILTVVFFVVIGRLDLLFLAFAIFNIYVLILFVKSLVNNWR